MATPVTEKINEIAGLCLHNPQNSEIQRSQTKHRLDIISKWAIPPGSKVLELGCGQGDCTAGLASVVGPGGHITAVDPGDLDYGGPFTLGQAQAHLSSSTLGSRITFVQDDPLHFIASIPAGTYDAAVLVHCIWYFSSSATLSAILTALTAKVKRIHLAEWSLHASSLSSVPHVLAALTQASLQCHKPAAGSNIRTIQTRKQICEAAFGAGLQLTGEATLQPDRSLSDGQWETGAVICETFCEEVQLYVKSERERAVFLSMIDAVNSSVSGLPKGLQDVTSMDVWTAVFSPVPDRDGVKIGATN